MPGFLHVPTPWPRLRQSLALVCLCAVASLAQAQSTTADDRLDPPDRVARLSYVAGELGLLPAGAADWSDARVNRPLTRGDRLSSGTDSRAELELGGGTLHIDSRTDLGLLELSDPLAQIELTQGTIRLAIRDLDEGESYEIDTPTLALVIDQPGSVRVGVDDNGDTRVSVIEGRATAYGENNAQRTLYAGRRYAFDDSNLATVTVDEIDGGDAFDAWSRERDRRYASSTSGRYVSDEVVGYQDLDRYGDWHDSDDYGAVWYPRHVASDWAPYRDGHWAYIAPWGWSWVDHSAWGFAPYHYGRWAFTHRGWGWIPGPRYARPVYAPALVAFIGGSGWSIGLASAPLGWFPLGPGDIYNPWYRTSRDYYGRVNISNIGHHRHRRDTIAHRIDQQYAHYRHGRGDGEVHYANRHAPHGITAVSRHAFGRSWAEQRKHLRLDPRQLADAPVLVHDAKLPPPVRAATVHPARHVPTVRHPRSVVARHAPAPRRHGGSERRPAPRFADTARLDRPQVHVLRRAEHHRQKVSAQVATVGKHRPEPTTAARPAGTHASRDSLADIRQRARRNDAALPSARFAPRSARDHSRDRVSERNHPAPATRVSESTLPSLPHFERATPLTPVATRMRADSITEIRRQARRRDAELASTRFAARAARPARANTPPRSRVRERASERAAPPARRSAASLPSTPNFRHATPAPRASRQATPRQPSFRDLRRDLRARHAANRRPTPRATPAPRVRTHTSAPRTARPARTAPQRHSESRGSKKYGKHSSRDPSFGQR